MWADTKTVDPQTNTKEPQNGKAIAKKENNLYVMPETDLEEILRELESLKPQVAIIDSIQTLHFAALTSSPGSVAQGSGMYLGINAGS